VFNQASNLHGLLLRPKDPEQAYIRVHYEPDWNRIAAKAGTTADVEGWRGWMNRILEEEEAGTSEA
jgi:hypothetical protein